MSHINNILPGSRLRQALAKHSPLQVVGVINAYCALLAENAGLPALYLSGAGVANAVYGLPDLALTTLTELVAEARKITSVTELPLIVDVDTGFGNALMIERTVKELCRANVAGLHIEDQVADKRCGHRPNKRVVETEEMVNRIRAAVAAKPYADFVIIARTDAVAVEGLEAAIKRAQAYVAAGADWIFAEAVTTLADYQIFSRAVAAPILANITEFGKTPLFTRAELASVGVQVILYPLSAFRAMSKAALAVYQTIHEQGTQASMIEKMQTRAELYQLLNYEELEKKT
ncbi:MAG: methylisocitrate lyase [Gammaproteobacteria bacterium]